MSQGSDSALHNILMERIHIQRESFRLSPPIVHRTFDNAWGAAVRVSRLLHPCPKGLLEWWRAQPSGHIILTHLTTQYCEGPQEVRGQTVHGAARLKMLDLVSDATTTLKAIAALLDHLCGSAGAVGSGRLSDGLGATPKLQEVGERIQKYWSLRYLEDLMEQQNSRDYFATALSLYLLRRQELEVADPAIYRLLRTSLMAELFWKQLRRDSS